MLETCAGGVRRAVRCPASGQGSKDRSLVPPRLEAARGKARGWAALARDGLRPDPRLRPTTTHRSATSTPRHSADGTDAGRRSGLEACATARGDDWHPTTSTIPTRGSPCPSGPWNAPGETRVRREGSRVPPHRAPSVARATLDPRSRAGQAKLGPRDHAGRVNLDPRSRAGRGRLDPRDHGG